MTGLDVDDVNNDALECAAQAGLVRTCPNHDFVWLIHDDANARDDATAILEQRLATGGTSEITSEFCRNAIDYALRLSAERDCPLCTWRPPE